MYMYMYVWSSNLTISMSISNEIQILVKKYKQQNFNQRKMYVIQTNTTVCCNILPDVQSHFWDVLRCKNIFLKVTLDILSVAAYGDFVKQYPVWNMNLNF